MTESMFIGREAQNDNKWQKQALAACSGVGRASLNSPQSHTGPTGGPMVRFGAAISSEWMLHTTGHREPGQCSR